MLAWTTMSASFSSSQLVVNVVNVLDSDQPLIEAAETPRELLRIQTHQFQDGGMQGVRVDFVFNSSKAEVVRGADCLAAFDAAAGQPH